MKSFVLIQLCYIMYLELRVLDSHLILHKFSFRMVSPTKLFHLQLSQYGLNLYCRWQELILVFLRVTVLEEIRLQRQSVW